MKAFSGLWYLPEFTDSVIYVFDTQTSCIEIRELFCVFFIHEKHQTYDTCDLSGEIVRVGKYY